jgi:hypothetical protein
MPAQFNLPARAKDLRGMRFYRLVVIEPVATPVGLNITSSFVWRCMCECGTEKITEARSLNAGSVKSCGCMKRDLVPVGNFRHGMHLSGEYQSWKGMIRRCTRKSHKNYDNYGGRGISVCDRWRAFDLFIADVGLRPSSKHTLDRHPDQNGNYEPGNVRWALRREQSLNMRRNRVVTAFGVTQPLAAFFERSGTTEYKRALYRLNTGRPAEEAIRIARGGDG